MLHFSSSRALAFVALFAALPFSRTLAAQSIVKDIRQPTPVQPSGSPEGFVSIGGVSYFLANDRFGRGELWKTDGSNAGTIRVKDIRPGERGADCRTLTAVGNKLFFTAFVDGYGRELWVSDGTAKGTTLVRDFAAGASGTTPTNEIIAFQGKAYFAANAGDGNGTELWSSDGTAAGTKLVTRGLATLACDRTARPRARSPHRRLR